MISDTLQLSGFASKKDEKLKVFLVFRDLDFATLNDQISGDKLLYLNDKSLLGKAAFRHPWSILHHVLLFMSFTHCLFRWNSMGKSLRILPRIEEIHQGCYEMAQMEL